MAEDASSTVDIIWTIGLYAEGGGSLDLQYMAPGGLPAHLVHLDQTGFPLHGAGEENRHAVGQPGHPLTVGAVALNGEGEGRDGFGVGHKRDLLVKWMEGE